MRAPSPEDTIAAIATPAGEGALGIVRMSGAEALPLAKRCFRRARAGPWRSHRLYYGTLVDPVSQEVLDHALCAYMRSPHSYTGADVIEFSCHGSPVVLRRTLAVLLQAGARLAERGEFTLRAFLNGRLDLTQAEAVMDVVRARTSTGLSLALGQLEGQLSHAIRAMRQRVLNLLARLEANIDFSEDGVPPVPPDELCRALDSLLDQIDRLLSTAQRGIVLREGIRAVLVGRPNVGKSSLLNAFVRADRAIVTDIPGTTRDVLEETVDMGGVPVILADTAGIVETTDIVEQFGIARSRRALEAADLIILVLDGSQPLQAEDRAVMGEVEQALHREPAKRLIVALNKADKGLYLTVPELRAQLASHAVVPTSAHTADGLDHIAAAVRELFLAGRLTTTNGAVVSSLRHREALRQAQTALREAQETAAADLPTDFVTIGLHGAVFALGELTGESATEDLLDRIFSQFCIGK